MEISPADQIFIDQASDFFQNPGPLVQSLNWIGKPVEKLAERLPEKVRNLITSATQKAIGKALVAAVQSFPQSHSLEAAFLPSDGEQIEKSSLLSSWAHKASTTFTGAVSGFFGIAALPVELPITTVLILRGILDQARLYGEDVQDLETRMECLMVFALGTNNSKEDSMESSYFTARAAHAQAVRQAAQYITKLSSKELVEALERGSAPAVLRLIAQIAQAFEIRVTQKMVADVVPILGAVTGGAVNFAFTDFYCRAARFHFGVRALEKKYGIDSIQDLMKQKMQLH